MSRPITRTRLAHKLCEVARLLGMGVHGVLPEIAAQHGVPLARFIRKGEQVPNLYGDSTRYADATGYYCPINPEQGTPELSLYIEEKDDRFTLVCLSCHDAAHHVLPGYGPCPVSLTARQLSCFLDAFSMGVGVARSLDHG